MAEQRSLDELEEVFRQVFHRMTKLSSTYLEKDLSNSQAAILELLEQDDRQMATRLAESLGVTSGAVTALCDKLIAAGYVSRTRTEEDRRVVLVEILPAGRDALEQFRQRRKEVSQLFYAGLAEADIHHLIRIYSTILTNLDAEKGTANGTPEL